MKLREFKNCYKLFWHPFSSPGYEFESMVLNCDVKLTTSTHKNAKSSAKSRQHARLECVEKSLLRIMARTHRSWFQGWNQLSQKHQVQTWIIWLIWLIWWIWSQFSRFFDYSHGITMMGWDHSPKWPEKPVHRVKRKPHPMVPQRGANILFFLYAGLAL